MVARTAGCLEPVSHQRVALCGLPTLVYLWKKAPPTVRMTACFRHIPSQFHHEAYVHTMTVEKPARHPSSDSATGSAVLPLQQAAGPRGHPTLDPPLIAVYEDPHAPPLVTPVVDHPSGDEHLPALIEALAQRAHAAAKEQGGRLPLEVFRELAENLVHADFAGVVVTILDHGNTIRVSDRGPGIPDKDAAVRPGFTSADARSRRFIRGVGSGFAVVREILAAMDGVLEIEDNLGCGTVVTVRVQPVSDTPLAPGPVPAYNLSERQLKTLLLAVELAPVGPTRIAQELGISTSTAYRDLVFLEDAGFVVSGESGRRSVTDTGLAYLDAVL